MLKQAAYFNIRKNAAVRLKTPPNEVDNTSVEREIREGRTEDGGRTDERARWIGGAPEAKTPYCLPSKRCSDAAAHGERRRNEQVHVYHKFLRTSMKYDQLN